MLSMSEEQAPDMVPEVSISLPSSVTTLQRLLPENAILSSKTRCFRTSRQKKRTWVCLKHVMGTAELTKTSMSSSFLPNYLLK